jgi:hypothetical protein
VRQSWRVAPLDDGDFLVGESLEFAEGTISSWPKAFYRLAPKS